MHFQWLRAWALQSDCLGLNLSLLCAWATLISLGLDFLSFKNNTDMYLRLRIK